MNGFSTFLQLQKVDVAKREVWGVAALEQPDRAGEIMDYEKSLPNFLNWSRDMEKASGGRSLGNVRAMHKDTAAGKVIHLEPRDSDKSIYIGAKIVDDNEWKKVLEGVYTGFSVGGSYGLKWPDAMLKNITRYEAKPVEISLVDVPCMPGAQFEIVKADGSSELRKLLTKGDFEGHPFRGNQWSDGETTNGGDNLPDRFVDVSKPLSEEDKAKNAEADRQFEEAKAKFEAASSHKTEWNTEVSRGISGTSSMSAADRKKKISEISKKGDRWTGMSLDTLRNEQDKHSQMLYQKFGEENVKRGNYPQEYKDYQNDMSAWNDILYSARFKSIKKLLEGAEMNATELLNKLNASVDPAMRKLADELNKAFPPAKKEDKADPEQESADPSAEGGDKKQDKPKSKDNPFAAKDKTADAEAEGESVEHENAETDEEEAVEEETGAESDEQTAGQPDTNQTEAIRAVVIQLLEELGFVQKQGDEMKMAAGVGELQKRLATQENDLQKAYDSLTARNKELTGDLAKLTVAVEDMAKRGGPAPVIRDLGVIGAESVAALQKAAALKDVIAQTTDPSVRQALQNQLATLEIKQIQSQK